MSASTYLNIARRKDESVLKSRIKAQEWLARLTSGRSDSIATIASEEHVSRGYVTRLIPLALMAPDLVQRIARGEHGPEFNAAKLMRLMPLPQDWGEQRAMLGFD